MNALPPLPAVAATNPTLANPTSLIDSARQSAESSNIFAKLSWVLIVFILFMLILRVTVIIMSYIFNKTSSPHILDGMVPGNEALIFQQDPASTSAKTIPLSNNQSGGLEFTWTVWIYISSIGKNGGSGMLNTIFTKGDGKPPTTNASSLINAPGLYLDDATNNLVVVMDTMTKSSSVNSNELTITNMPLSKWIHVVIRCTGTVLDVYINGTIANSKTFVDDVPKQNFGNVNVATNGGFNGFLSNLWYYDYSLSSMEIQNLLAAGPKTTLAKPSAQNSLTSTDYNYLATQWYLS
jgi:hypothetical protein